MHRRVVRREADRPRIRHEIADPQWFRLANENAENPAASGQHADLLVGLVTDAVRHEPLEHGTARVDHAERGITGTRQGSGRLHEPLEQGVERHSEERAIPASMRARCLSRSLW